MMTLRVFCLACVTLVLVGAAIAFLWVQTGLPTAVSFDPWGGQLQFFPSIFAVWLPLIYLFFTSCWLVLRLQPEGKRLRFWGTLDVYSYGALLLFLGLQIIWKDEHTPVLVFRVCLLALLVAKSVLLFRALYQFPQCLQPLLLFFVSTGLYLLSYPLTFLPLSTSVFDLFQHAMAPQLGVIAIKSICLSFMALETFRISVELTKSSQSAFLSWVIVAFSFPVLGFPRFSHIFLGALLIFILRLAFSRLDIKELMFGLLEPTRISIAIKLLVVLAVLIFSGAVFWSNVKPGFAVHGIRAVEAAMRTLFDAQFGLLSYAPIYWLAFFGVVYSFVFRKWNEALLFGLVTMLFAAYHLAIYGVLEQDLGQHNIAPFLPFLGGFIAIAHHRFRRMTIFRVCIRILGVLTTCISMLLLGTSPEIQTFPSKFAELQHDLMVSLGRDLSSIFPSMSFRSLSLSLVVWGSGMAGLSLLCCCIRTRSFFSAARKIRACFERNFLCHPLTFYPVLVLSFLLIGTCMISYGKKLHPLEFEGPLVVSQTSPHWTLPVDNTSGKISGVLVVSSVTGKADVPHGTALASLTIHRESSDFETFTLKAGRDTSEERLEQNIFTNSASHFRAAIYRSWPVVVRGMWFEAHEYYTRIMFRRPIALQKITVTFLAPDSFNASSTRALKIHDILLLQE